MDEFATGYAPYKYLGGSPRSWLPCSISAGVLAVLALQVSILHQQAAMADNVAALQLALLQNRLFAAETSLPLANVPASAPRMPPARFLLDGLTPSADQALRGDCWLFATTGILEDSYRRFGVRRGWFKPGEYMRLSRQAIGIAFLEQCKRAPNSFCPSNNLMPENVLSWGNTTEGQDGADERLMYYLRHTELGSYAALPDAACKYYTGEVNNPFKPDWRKERECGISTLKASRESNPLSFEVKSMKVHYARDDIKRQLLESGYPMALGLGEIATPFYTPCEKRAGCDEATAQCVPCPLERAYVGVGCCVLKKKPMVSMKGEWFHLPGEPLIAEGGHAINIVGYNDGYRTEWGAVGGYIVRNTWRDGLGFAHNMRARGSHSAAFFMQDVGDLDDSIACPNPQSPRSWMPCDDAAACSLKITEMEAKATRKILELQCTDRGLPSGSLPTGACVPGDGHYLINMTEFGTAGLFVSCFLHLPSKTTTCHPPLTIDDLALVYTPTAAGLERLGENDPDVCGYNFMPYETYEALQAKFGGVTASSFEIEWAERSYVSRAVPGYDYTFITKSTHAIAPVPIYEPMNF